MKGTHEYQDDPRNASILIDINGELLPREKAMVSVFRQRLRTRRRRLGRPARTQWQNRLSH